MSVILSEVKGFTPVIDVVVKDVGLIEAVVYGVVWRYCQREDGVCTASLKTIGEQVGVSSKTAKRHIKALCSKGYLEDTTPGMRNRPHVYRDTGKVKIKGMLEAGRTESPTKEVGGTESPSGGDRESHLGGTESPLKILDTKKIDIHDDKDQKPDGRAWFLALSEVCVVDLAVMTEAQRGQLAQSSKKLRSAGATPKQIEGFGAWWYENDWRGKKGQPPTPAQVRTEWGKFKRDGGENVVRIGR